MKIALCHSMQYAEKAKEVQQWFQARGHEAFPSSFNELFIGLSDEEKETLKERDSLMESFKLMNNGIENRILFLFKGKDGDTIDIKEFKKILTEYDTKYSGSVILEFFSENSSLIYCFMKWNQETILKMENSIIKIL